RVSGTEIATTFADALTRPFLISNSSLLLLGASAAGFRLRYVTLNLFGVGPENGTNEKTPTIVNVNLRNRVNVELFHDRRVPIDDVDFAQRNLRIRLRHLLQAWRELFTRAAPIRIKIDNSHVAECEMFCDVHLRAVSDHLGLLAAASDDRSRRRKLIALVFERFLSGPIFVSFFGHFPS